MRFSKPASKATLLSCAAALLLASGAGAETLFAPAPPAPPVVPPPPEAGERDLFDRAEDAFERAFRAISGNRRYTVEELENMPEPTNGPDWYKRGNLLHSAKMYDLSIAAFKESAKRNFQKGASLYNVACGLALTDNTDAAFEYLDKAAEAGFELRPYLSDDSDLRSLRRDPRFDELTELHGGGHEKELLLRRLDKLEQSDSPRGERWFELGMEFHSRGMYEEAIPCFTSARELGFASGTSAFNEACGYSMLGKERKAIDALRLSIELGGPSVSSIESDSDFDPIRGSSAYARVLELARDNTPIDSSMKREDLHQAEGRYSRLTKDLPKSGRAWFNLGYSQLAQGKAEEATRSFKRAHELEFMSATTAYNIACAQARAGQKDQAFKWLETAVAEGFKNPGFAGRDEDLRSLHGDRRFDEVLASMKSNEKHSVQEHQPWFKKEGLTYF